MFDTALTRGHGHVRRSLIVALATLLLFTALAIVPGSPFAPEAGADAGDFGNIDLAAATPGTYTPTISNGGGVWSSRVESLEGGDFKCDDWVVFLTRIPVDATATSTPMTIELDYSFTAHATGQPGVSFGAVEGVMVNPDPANSPTPSPAVVTLVSSGINGTEFVKPATLDAKVRVAGLDPGDEVIVRVPVQIHCNGQEPTGNLQGSLAAVNLTATADGLLPEPEAIPSGGNQTIPLKSVGKIIRPATLVIVKNTNDGDGTFRFASGTLAPAPFDVTTVGGTGEQIFYDLSPGIYDVNEDPVPAGWDLTSATCDDGSLVSSINLGEGETVTCTFENSKQDPSMTVVKSSATTSLSAPGTVTYSYLVTNTGNVAITGLVLVDDNDNNDMSCGATTIAVGGSTTCSATHTFTQAELDADGSPTPGSGVLFNEVTASSNETPDATDDLSIPITQNPSILLAKSGTFTDESGDGFAQAGETISYSFAVANNGNVTLTNVTLDDLVGDVTVTGGPIALLPVGAFDDSTFTGSYTITQADIDAGTFYNLAEACGIDPGEAEVCDDDDHREPLTQNPSIDIEKATNGFDADTADLAPVITVGDPVEWTYLVTNTGNVPVTDITVTDDVLGAITCPVTMLAVGASMTCEAFGVAELAAYANVGVAVGYFGDTTVTDEDPSHYAGIAVGGTAQLGDTVWQDTNKNGVQDSGEAGINGAKVVLKDADGTVIATATTAKGPWDGWYKFVGLDAGRYTVTLDMSSVSGSLTTASSFTIDLADGVEYLEADFGLAEALPTTGANTEGMLIAALLMLGVGGALVLATRRRREEA